MSRPLALILSWPLPLALILVLGAALRFHGLDWDYAEGTDTPQQMHPDERFLSLVSDRLDWPNSIGGYFDTDRSTLNPYNDGETNSYVYGTLPLFLAKAVSTIAGDDDVNEVRDSYDDTIVWGRRLTALFDTMTIAVVFFTGWVLFGRRVGLVASALYALAVLPTQLAHFWTVDPFLTFFGAMALLEGALLVRTRNLAGSAGLYAALGLTLGLAGACKVNGILFLTVPFVATALRYGLRDDRHLGLTWLGAPSSAIPRDPPYIRGAGSWMNDVSLLCMTLAIALIVFRVAQPYAFTGPDFWNTGISQRWWDDIQRELENQQGNANNPPFFQWAGRTPFAWPLQNMVLWGLGPTLGVAALVSTVAAAVAMFRRREVSFLLPLTFIAVIFAFQGSRFTAYMRYFEPMYPALCLLAAWGLVTVWAFARRPAAPEHAVSPLHLGEGLGVRAPLPSPAQSGEGSGVRAHLVRVAALGAVVAVAAGTAWWAVAFQSIYNQEQPRLEASRWMMDNLPDGTAVTGEYWDDTLPYPVPNPMGKRFKLVETGPYDPDSPEKVRQLVYGLPSQPGVDRGGGLDEADYVAISSNRIRDSVVRLERKYPATIRYYKLLDSGELGFELVKTWTVHPTFLGLSLDDSSAEESFTVYDHPEVRLYQKTDRWNAERAVALLNEARPETATLLLPRQGRTNGLQFTPQEAAAQQSGGTFTDVFDDGHVFSHAPWFWWLLWLELAAVAAIPWVTWLFRALPDRGYALTKLLGVVAVALPTWLLVAWGAADFSGTLVWAVFASALVAGAALAILRRGALFAELRERWPAILAVEALFLAVFFAFLAIRAYNPDLWHHPQGGEKPMEIAYLTAVIRSTHLPPYDPWFAGGTMNYYYMGWFFLAVPVRALRLMPETAFNLGVPTFAALAATTAYSTASTLVALSRRATARARDISTGVGRRRLRAEGPIILGGLLGAFLLVFIANLDPLHQTVERLQAVNDWSTFEGTPVVGGAVGITGGFWNWAFGGADLPPYDWWRSSRVHIGSFDITEFPYFSLLFADLHPHLMGLPFFGLAVALAVAYAANARAGLRPRGWLLAVLMGLGLGLVRTVHTWDFPTAVILAAAGVVVGQVFAPGRWQQRFWDGAGHLALAAAVLVVAFAPYTAHFEVFNSGVIRAHETTEPQQYVAQFGIFLLVALAFLGARYYEELDVRDGDPGRNVLLATAAGWWEVVALVIFLAGFAAFTWRFDFTVVGLSAVLAAYFGNLLWLEWRRRDFDLGRILATLTFMLAFAIAAGVDLVTVKNDIERMNTVFKFGLQAWQLFALAAAYATWYVWRVLSPQSLVLPNAPGTKHLGLRTLRWGVMGMGAFLLLSGSIYLWSGARARQEARFVALDPTLDGLAWLDTNPVFVEDMGDRDPANDRALNLADDRPLIDWLRQNVEGSPVIVEAVGPLYHWTGRFSEYTGLPAVIGWDWHQTQQRWDYGALVQERRIETDRFWKSTDSVAAGQYLRKYNVSYVVVGTEEVAQAPQGIQKFASMPALQRVYSIGDYAIYRVDQSKLAPPATTAALPRTKD